MYYLSSGKIKKQQREAGDAECFGGEAGVEAYLSCLREHGRMQAEGLDMP